MRYRWLLILGALCAAPLAAGKPSSSLVGLWGARQEARTLVAGDLTLDGRGSHWIASIGGYQAEVVREGDTVTFALPGGEGSFRGWYEGSTLHGLWIQPSSSVTAFPYQFASPVPLREIEPGVWSGPVTPLPATIEIYVKVSDDGQGGLSAFFWDPFIDFSVGSDYRVEVSGTSVQLVNKANTTDRISGTWDANDRSLSLSLTQFNATLRFHPQTGETALGFYPRLPGNARYAYREPIDYGDGWPVASASAMGVDQTHLEALVQHIIDAPLQSSLSPAVQAVLIARRGKLILEEYFQGFSQDQFHDLRSAGKTLTTTLAGIAIDQGRGLELSTSLHDVFPSAAETDRRKQAMTLADAMSMRSGLYCSDADPDAPANELNVMTRAGASNWATYIWNVPMAGIPGGDVAVYCSADMHLAAAAVARATGSWLPEFFDRYFARPLGITRYYLNLTPDGQFYGAGGEYLRPRDSMRLGQLFLDKGLWQGRRVVSERWVATATAPHAKYLTGNEGKFTGSPPGSGAVHRYGYGWHLLTAPSPAGPLEEYMATGNGGQIIAVVPRLDLVIVFAGGNYNNSAWRKEVQELVPQYILPSADSNRR
jgi:CubicO group peptidase (beta-lactamase class C family)